MSPADNAITAISLLRATAEAHPHLRVGQIIANALTGTPYERDPFYCPDDVFCKQLVNYLVKESQESR